MNPKFAWGIAVCLILPLAAGCTATESGVIRGQSPAPAGGAYCGPVPHGQFVDVTCPSCDSGQCPIHAGGGFVHPHAGYGSGHPHHFHGHRGGFFASHLRGLGTGWYPTHYHGYHYDEEDELVYPPQNQPAAVVQYPYYTLKGPDDFFLR